MRDNEHHSLVDATYMNKIPFKSRELGKKLLRDYLLQELLQLKKSESRSVEFKRANLPINHWNELVNFVILTKLSTFNIHHDLQPVQLKKLASIVSNCLEKKSSTLDEILANLDQDAIILRKWFQQLQYQLRTKKS